MVNQYADGDWKISALNSTTDATRHVGAGRKRREEKPGRTVVVIHPSTSSRSNEQRRAAVDQRKGKPPEKRKGKPPAQSSQAKGKMPYARRAYIPQEQAEEDPAPQVAYNSTLKDHFKPDVTEGKTGILSRKTRKLLCTGLEQNQVQEYAMKASLMNRLTKCTRYILAVTTLASLFEPSIGRVTEFVNPCMDACHVTADWKNETMQIYKDLDPSLSMMYVPYGADDTPEPQYMTELIENLTSRKILIIDTRHSMRWEQRCVDPVVQCNGDVSFFTNDEDLRQRITHWFNNADGNVPRSVDDIASEDFLESLTYFVEESKLDALTSYAFAGTEEDQAEPPDPDIKPIDAEDEGGTQNLDDGGRLA